MTGVYKGESMAKLLRHYHFWGQLNTRSDPIPPAYNENDQVKYAGLYVAQQMHASCASGRQYRARGHGCFHFLHDGVRRCAQGCAGATGSGRLCLAWRLIARSCSSRICTTRGRTRVRRASTQTVGRIDS